MRLGLNLGYQAAWTTPADHLAMAQEADRLGYAVVWSAEAYGSDSVSMLAWIAGQTQQIDLGAAVMQIPARTPAMSSGSLDVSVHSAMASWVIPLPGKVVICPHSVPFLSMHIQGGKSRIRHTGRLATQNSKNFV